jgi:pilus assembly protein Flp/PilA
MAANSSIKFGCPSNSAGELRKKPPEGRQLAGPTTKCSTEAGYPGGKNEERTTMNSVMDTITLACAKVAFVKMDMEKKLQTAWRDDRGVTAIEYGLIAALIAVVIIGAVTLVGEELQTTFTTISTKLSDANAT